MTCVLYNFSMKDMHASLSKDHTNHSKVGHVICTPEMIPISILEPGAMWNKALLHYGDNCAPIFSPRLNMLCKLAGNTGKARILIKSAYGRTAKFEKNLDLCIMQSKSILEK